MGGAFGLVPRASSAWVRHAGSIGSIVWNGAAMALLKVQDVAQRLNCSKSQVYELISSGILRHYRIGKGQGGIRVSDEQIQEFLKERQMGGNEIPPTSIENNPKTARPTGSFTMLDADRLHAAWQKQGVPAGRTDADSVPSSG